MINYYKTLMMMTMIIIIIIATVITTTVTTATYYYKLLLLSIFRYLSVIPDLSTRGQCAVEHFHYGIKTENVC